MTRAETARLTGLAVVAATGVGVVYLPQSIQQLTATEFDTDTALPQVLTQAGYACGILFLLPLSDVSRLRRQVLAQLLVTAAALGVAVTSDTFSVFCAALFVTGFATTVGPVLVAAAFRLRAPGDRAVTTLRLAGAFMVGIAIVRSLGGAAAETWGWRPSLAATAMFLLVVCVPLTVVSAPVGRASGTSGYVRLLVQVPRTVLNIPTVLVATTVQACCFGAFIAFWSVLTIRFAALRASLPFDGALLSGLAAAVAGCAAIACGRRLARLPARSTALGGLLAVAGLVAALVGTTSPTAVFVALTLVTAGSVVVQGIVQAAAMSSVPATHAARANTVFMVGGFGSGAAATAAAHTIYEHHGFEPMVWAGIVCFASGTLVALAARPWTHLSPP